MEENRFLADHWMKFCPIIILIVLTVVFRSKCSNSLFRMNGYLMVSYLIHQIEEHWVDLYGEHYSFYRHTNQLINFLLNENSSVNLLTPNMILVVNTVMVWMVGFLALYQSNVRSPSHLFSTLAMISLCFINAMVHVVPFVKFGWKYNPGLVTAVILLLPSALYGYSVVRHSKEDGLRLKVGASLIWAVLGHGMIMVGAIGSNWFHIIPTWTVYVTMFLFSIAPCVMFPTRQRPKPWRKQMHSRWNSLWYVNCRIQSQIVRCPFPLFHAPLLWAVFQWCALFKNKTTSKN